MAKKKRSDLWLRKKERKKERKNILEVGQKRKVRKKQTNNHFKEKEEKQL